MTPQGAPNDAAKVADSAHQDAPNRESTLGASEVLDNFRETSVVLPLQSTQDSETILKYQEEQCAEPLVKKAQAKDHGSSQEQQQQQANTSDGCAVPPLEQGSASRAPETAPELPDSPQATEESGNQSAETRRPQFLQGCWILEIFAGTAAMVAAAAAEGLGRSVGIDHVRLASRRGKVIQLDLLLPSHRQLLWKWLRAPGLVAVWLAPPCGTASRAREIPLRRDSEPRPLRTSENPAGRPDLSPDEAERVGKANSLYRITAEIWSFCLQHDILVVIENPYRSFFWHLPEITSILQDDRAVLVRCDFCMFGGKRLKKTALLANDQIIHALAVQCDGQHEHLPWGVVDGEFATKQETAYTNVFCRTFMLALTRHLRERGFKDEREVQSCLGQATATAKVLTTKAHTKRAASFRMLPEFKQTLRWTVSRVQREQVYRPTWMPVDRIPGLKVHTVGEIKVSPVSGSPTDVWLDVCWSPQEFVLQARKAGHPSHMHLGIPPALKQAIDKIARLSSSELAKIRASQSRRWLARASQLQEAEQKFKESLPLHIQQSLQNKRVLLFKEMLEASHYPDKAVADDLARGFSLVGHLALPEGWAPDFRPATLSLEDLVELTQESNEQVVKEVAASTSFTEELWQKSMEEVDKGWSEGPFSLDQAPEGAIFSKRFAIQQGKKVRPIDDLSQSFLNACFGSEGKIELHDAETITAAILMFMRRSDADLVGKTIDLKSAYRQLPLSTEALRMSFVAVKCPRTGQVMLFRLLCLPFGAVAAVHSFIRISLALCHLGHFFWLLPWSSFYDDYTLLSTSTAAQSSDRSASFLLDLLGFDFDRDGDKAQPFKSHFRALGVEFNLAAEGHKTFQVGNTKERTDDLIKDLAELATSGKIGPKTWNRLRGRLHFVSSQLTGRVPKRLMRRISEYASAPRHEKGQHQSALRNCLLQLQDYISEARPRTLRAFSSETVYLFTDASQEGEAGLRMGLGAVLFNQQGNILAWFGISLPQEPAEVLVAGKQKVINELESLAVLLSFVLCEAFIKERHIMCYLDNEAARVTLLKMTSDSETLSLLAHTCALLEEAMGMFTFYGRVPSKSNVADAPSRLDFRGLPPDKRIRDDEVLAQVRAIVVNLQQSLSQGNC